MNKGRWIVIVSGGLFVLAAGACGTIIGASLGKTLFSYYDPIGFGLFFEGAFAGLATGLLVSLLIICKQRWTAGRLLRAAALLLLAGALDIGLIALLAHYEFICW